MRGMRGHEFLGWRARRATAAVMLGLIAVAIATASTTASGNAAAVPAKGCGSLPTGPIQAPASLLSSLPASVRSSYSGLPFPIQASAFSHWKPPHGRPWTIGVDVLSTANATQAQQLQDDSVLASQLEKTGVISNLVTDIDETNSVPEQIQQLQAMIEQKVSLIIVSPADPIALLPTVQAAYAADIPVISSGSVINSPDVINVDNSAYEFGGLPAAYMAKYELGGKGNVILEEGIPTNGNAQAQLAGATAAFAQCPGIHILTTLVGDFSSPVAKSAMLEYLTTNPGVPIAGVWDGGVQSLGELSAFLQLGKNPPAITNIGAVLGTIAYWNKHKNTFKSAAMLLGETDLHRIIMDVAVRMLEGKGPIANAIIVKGVLYADKNLSKIVRYNAIAVNINNPQDAQQPPFTLLSDKALDAFFSKPGVKPSSL